MGFRVESLATMNTIAANMESAATEAKSQADKVNNALGSLTTVIKGGGVEKTLPALESGVTEVTGKTIELFTRISEFIKTQSASYASTEDALQAAFASAQSNLDQMEGQ